MPSLHHVTRGVGRPVEHQAFYISTANISLEIYPGHKDLEQINYTYIKIMGEK
jgi:hypothetical protein